MSTPVILRRVAQREFDDNADWYEQRSAGLGQDFIDEVFPQKSGGGGDSIESTNRHFAPAGLGISSRASSFPDDGSHTRTVPSSPPG